MSRVAFPFINFATKLVRCSTTTTTMQYSSKCPTKLTYHEHGIPWRVVGLQAANVPEPKDNEVLVRMLAAPVNHADLSTIEGKHPVDNLPPTTPGIEGIGEIQEIGPGVTEFAKGDRVVFTDYCLGTWRTHLTVPKEKLFKVPKELSLVEGATLASNPCAAYRMLRDFVSLEPGDTVIQNAANSNTGQCVIQLCKAWGFNSVNVLRERPNISDARYYLKTLGATHVFTDEELRKSDLFRTGELKKPKLALNCVGGESAWNLTRVLQPGSTMVTYGGMSRQPVLIPTSTLVFKGIQVRGFWLVEWAKKNFDTMECRQMFQELSSMLIDDKLKAPLHELIDYNYYQGALMKAVSVQAMTGKKYIINFEYY